MNTGRFALLASALLLAHAAPASGQTVLLSESFDAFPTCGTTCGNACVLPVASGWLNALTDQRDWTVDAGGTTSNGTGPSVDHTLGNATGRYLYTESSGACSNSAMEVLSPTISLTGATSPVMRFWYHMFGATQGTLHVDVIYNPTGVANRINDVIPAINDNVNRWQRSGCVPLNPALGDAQVVFRGMTGTSFTSDMAIDDVEVVDLPAVDLAMTNVRVSGACAGAREVTVDITNDGGTAATNFTVQYAVNGQAPVSETFTGSIPSCGSASFTFAAPANLAAGTSSITATVVAVGDANAGNDNVTVPVQIKPVISSFPYAEDFESGPGGWIQRGGIWALGAPADAVINSADSGVNAWVTNLNGNYPNNARALLEPACIDATNLTNPRFEASIWYEAEFSWDGMKIQTSTNGVDWIDVGAVGDPVNWYNDGTIAGLAPFGAQIGWTGRVNSGNGSNGWRPVAHDLGNGTAGTVFEVRIVFASDFTVNDEGVAIDTVRIFDNPPRLDVTDISTPNAGSFLPGAVDVVTQTLSLSSPAQTTDITAITLDKLGTLPDADITAIRIYQDDGDGVVELLTDDVLVGSAGTFTGGVATVTMTNPINIVPDGRIDLYVVVDLALTAAPGNTFGTSVDVAADVATLVPSLIAFPNGPASSPLSSTFVSIDILPFADTFDAGTPSNRQVVVRAGLYPTATATGTAVVSATTVNVGAVTATGRVVAGPGLVIAPNSDPFMMALTFPNGPAAAAIDYYLDLSSYDVNNDDIYVDMRWNNVRMQDDPADNIFVSFDGGVTWAMSIYNWDFTNPSLPAWNGALVDLSAATRAAGLTFTTTMVVRFQGAGDNNAALLLDDLWTGIPEDARVERIAQTPIPSGGLDLVGTVPGGVPFTLDYTFYNDGQRDLFVDTSSVMVQGAVNVNVVATPTVAITVAPGGSATESIALEVPNPGNFQLGVTMATNDPRRPAGVSFMIQGNAVFDPDIDLMLADGTPLPNGATQSFGSASAGALLSSDYVVNNVGGGGLTLTGTPTVELRNAVNITSMVVGAPPRQIAPLGSETFAVALTPQGAGPFSYELAILSNDPDEGTYVVTATGTATSPEIAVERGGADVPDQGTDDLAMVEVGAAQQLTYTITNAGNADLHLLGAPIVALGGATNVTATVTQPATATIAAGADVTFVVDATVDATGPFSVTVTIPNDDIDEGGYSFTLGGQGFVPAPAIQISRGGTPVANGGTDDAGGSVPGTAQTFTYTIENIGTLDLVLSGPARVENTTNVDAQVSTQPALTLAPMATETLELTFSASAVGAYSFDVVVDSNDADDPTYTITVRGTGDAEAPEIAIEQPAGTPRASGSTIDVGTVKIGQTETLSFTIRNTGAGDLDLTASPFVSIVGPTNATSAVSVQPTSPVTAGQSTTFDVTIAPDAAGAFGATVRVESSDGDEATYDLVLSGLGEANVVVGPPDEGGCSCEAVPVRGTQPTWAVFALAAVGLFLRRRR